MWKLFSSICIWAEYEILPWKVARFIADLEGEGRLFRLAQEPRDGTPEGLWPLRLEFFAEPSNRLLLWRNAEGQWRGSAEGMIPADAVTGLAERGIRFT